MGSFVKEGDYTIVFKTLVPLPAKTCKYTLQGRTPNSTPLLKYRFPLRFKFYLWIKIDLLFKDSQPIFCGW